MLRKKDAGILKPFYLFKSLKFLFLVNYNLQDPGKRGCWFQGKVEKVRPSLLCTLYVGVEQTPVERCKILFQEDDKCESSFINDVNQEMELSESEDKEYQERERVKLSSTLIEIQDSALVDRNSRTKKPRPKFNTLHYIPIDVLNQRNKPDSSI